MHRMLSELDTGFIDNLSTRMITNFHNDVCSLVIPCDLFQTFPREFIDGNPRIFLKLEWTDVPKLKRFFEGEDF